MSSYLASYDESLEAFTQRMRGNWKKFEAFAWRDKPDDAADRCIVYTSNRDADCLTRSNAAAIAKVLDGLDGCEVFEANHWACGWVSGYHIRVDSPAFVAFYALAKQLEEYPVLDEYDWSEREVQEADELWACYSVKERIAYMRRHYEQFTFSSFADMMGCVRGAYFAGEPSELVS